jgi:hypothetical protein
MIKTVRQHKTILFFGFVYFISRLPLLSFDIINVDAPAWNYRSIQFISYIKNLNFYETYRTYHPGVTVMWLSGLGQELHEKLSELFFGYVPKYTNVSDFHNILISETLPLIFVSFFLIVLSYRLLIKLSDRKVAFYSVLVLILEPFFIANTRVLHLDGMLSLFCFNAILLFISYLKFWKKLHLVLSGIFVGLSVLTKISGAITLPAMLLIATSSRLNIRRFVYTFLVISVSVIATIFFLFPALWVDPIRVFLKILNDGVLNTGQGGQPQIFFGKVTDNPGPLYYILEFFFRASPVTFLGLFGGFFLFVSKVKSRRATFMWLSNNKYLLFLFIYATAYFLFMTLSSKKIDRYLMPLFPISSVFVGIVLSNLSLSKRLISLGVIITSFAVSFSVFPDFFAYNNPIIGGTHVAVNVVGLQDWATGYQRVVDYLHKRSNPEKITIATYNESSVRPIFLGNVVSFDKQEDLSKIDYVIVQRYESRLAEIKSVMSLEKVFYIGSYDYYYLYKNNKIN